MEKIIQRIEDTVKKADKPAKRWDSEAECIAGARAFIISSSRLKASANKAISLSISEWDEGLNPKHVWKGGSK